MSAIRAFFGKLPRPSGRQAAVGAAALSAAAGGAWYYQQNADGKAEAVKLAQEAAKKNEAQRAAVEDAMKKEADTKPPVPQPAAEEAPKQ